MRRFTLPLLGGALLLGACTDGLDLPTAAVPGAPSLSAGVACDPAALIAAIEAANTNPAPDTITLAAGCTYTLSDSYENTSNGLPRITGSLTIEGNGATIARSRVNGTPQFRILEIEEATVSISDLTITGAEHRGTAGAIFVSRAGASVTFSRVTVSGNRGSFGGGIYNRGTLALVHSTVSGNRSVEEDRGLGGGIRNDPGAALTLIHSTVSGNSAGNGGGIYNTGTLTVAQSTVSGNEATDGGGGGGIWTGGTQGTLLLMHSTVSGNTAGTGGGIESAVFGEPALASTTILNSTISGNTADRGGGIRNRDGSTRIVHSTITANQAPSGGGGVLTGGSSAPADVKGSLIWGNTTGGSTPTPDDVAGDATNARFNSLGHNLIGAGGQLIDVEADFRAPGDQTGVGPGAWLGALADNGGPTRTHALLTGSPAIDAGTCTDHAGATVATDQRGFVRPAGTACDIGAFEAGAAAPPPPDTRAPTITLTTPAQGAAFLLGQSVLADYTCADEAGGSGLASCVGTLASGAAIPTTSVGGERTFRVDASDVAGNTAFVKHTYRVEYAFSGFEAPIAAGVRNVAKAGQTIPLKWRLTDASGNPVTNLSSAQVSFVSTVCDQGGPEEAVGESAGGSGLQNLGNGRYQFNWKTASNLANRCGVMHLNLGEGTTRTAEFRFTR